MSRRDLFHEAVVHALERDGWTVTDDPYYLEYGEQTLQIDLGAEMPIAAERGGRKIAVEIKSFAGKTTMAEFYAAVGQFVTYQDALQVQEPERILYLAVPDKPLPRFSTRCEAAVCKRNFRSFCWYIVLRRRPSRNG